MRFQAARFDRLLSATPGHQGLGQAAVWRRAVKCPCRAEYSGGPRVDCPVCSGLGVTYDAPLTGHAAFSGAKAQREWAEFGQWQSGDVVLTIPSNSPVYAIGEEDRLTLLDSSEPFHHIGTRGAEDDKAPREVIALEYAAILQGELLVRTDLPTIPEGGGAPIWAPGEGPDPGAQYSLRGRRRMEYFVFRDMVQDFVFHGGVRLPRKVVARRLDLAAK